MAEGDEGTDVLARLALSACLICLALLYLFGERTAENTALFLILLGLLAVAALFK